MFYKDHPKVNNTIAYLDFVNPFITVESDIYDFVNNTYMNYLRCEN